MSKTTMSSKTRPLGVLAALPEELGDLVHAMRAEGDVRTVTLGRRDYHIGTVHGAPPGGHDAPVANATVSFYALDTNGHGVLLGSAATDAKGQYKAILPDVAQPGTSRSGD